MSQFETLARPYAKAVYQQALFDQTVTQWQEFLKITAAFIRSEDVIALLSDAHFFSKFKEWLNESLLSNRKEVMRKEENNLLDLLYENKRLLVLPDIEKKFNYYVYRNNNVCRAKVYTAKTLTDKQQELIKHMLSKKIQKDVILEVVEQPNLLAGVKIEYEGLVLDQSIKGRIEQFTQKLEDLRK